MVANIVRPGGGVDGARDRRRQNCSDSAESRHEYVARVGSGARAEPRIDAEFALDVFQDGDVVRVRATEEMTAQTVELRSIVTVNDEERYRGEWRRTWRAP